MTEMPTLSRRAHDGFLLHQPSLSGYVPGANNFAFKQPTCQHCSPLAALCPHRGKAAAVHLDETQPFGYIGRVDSRPRGVLLSTPMFETEPDRCALVMLDFQPMALSSIADSDGLIELAKDAVDTARRSGVHIVYVRVALDDADYDAIPPTNKVFAPVATSRYLSDSDAATAIHPALDVQPQDTVIRKTRVGAFSTTPLRALLQSRGIDTVLLAGLATSGAVLSTVRDGADLDLRLVLVSDCIADPDDDVHEFLMTRVLSKQAYVTTTSELGAVFGDSNVLAVESQA